MGAEKEVKKESQPNPNPNNTPNSNPNPLSQSQFLLWKRNKEAVAAANKAEASRKRAADIAAGTVQMNGRELFLQEPWVFDNTIY